MRFTLAAAFATLAVLAPTASADAQSRADRQRESVRQVIVYGNDPCPRGTGEIIVCARRPESERYRVPQDVVDPEAPAARSNLDRDQEARELSASGIGSCSPDGPGGASGCLLREIDRSRVGRDGKLQDASEPD